MDAQWIAFAGLAGAVLVQVIATAFFLGRLFEKVRGSAERLDKLEASEKAGDGANGALTLAVARLEVQMAHATTDLGEIKAELKLQGNHRT